MCMLIEWFYKIFLFCFVLINFKCCYRLIKNRVMVFIIKLMYKLEILCNLIILIIRFFLVLSKSGCCSDIFL